VEFRRPFVAIKRAKPIDSSAMNPPAFGAGYKRYAIVSMTALNTVVLVDRGLMTMLLQPIKDDLHLSDTQLGFLTGIAFALFYVILGIPIARWADRGNRVTISALAIGLLSLATMGCFLVTSFMQLLFLRVAAAVGEAGCRAPAYSLIGDYCPQAAERTRAMYIYDAAGPIAAVFSYVVAGSLNELVGWRLTFLLVGLPGLLLAVAFKWTIVEPRTQARHQAPVSPATSMGDVLATMWRQRSCRHVTVAMILIFIMSSGLSPWYAAFMMRSHGMGSAQLGVWLGTVFIAGATAGLLLGTYVMGRWFRENERGQLRLGALTVALAVPCLMGFLLLPQRYLALSAMLPLLILVNTSLPAVFALLQRVVPTSMCATVLSVVMMLANLIGMGLGPQAVGILSDFLNPQFGVDALRYAMLIVSLAVILAAYHLWAAGRTIGEDLRTVSPQTALPSEQPA
jgi:MFS family permease